MLTFIVIAIAVVFYATLIIAAHMHKVPVLELTEDDKVS